jgi:hypothetical protein
VCLDVADVGWGGDFSNRLACGGKVMVVVVVSLAGHDAALW